MHMIEEIFAIKTNPNQMLHNFKPNISFASVTIKKDMRYPVEKRNASTGRMTRLIMLDDNFLQKVDMQENMSKTLQIMPKTVPPKPKMNGMLYFLSFKIYNDCVYMVLP